MHVLARAFVEAQVKSLKGEVVESSGWEMTLWAQRKLGRSVGRRGREGKGRMMLGGWPPAEARTEVAVPDLCAQRERRSRLSQGRGSC